MFFFINPIAHKECLKCAETEHLFPDVNLSLSFLTPNIDLQSGTFGTSPSKLLFVMTESVCFGKSAIIVPLYFTVNIATAFCQGVR